jgi:predicted nucleic acid-binding protein
LLDAHADGIVQATTTIEVIQEFLHIRSRRRSRGDAASLARDFASAFDLVIATAEDLAMGITLYERHPRLGAFDAVLAAVALHRHAEALVSADRAFGEVSNLIWIDPGGAVLERLLSPDGQDGG